MHQAGIWNICRVIKCFYLLVGLGLGSPKEQRKELLLIFTTELALLYETLFYVMIENGQLTWS